MDNQQQQQQSNSSNIQLPPGFRFHPSDEELIVHYLRNKATSLPIPPSVVAEVDLYKHDPWDLPKMALFGDKEWFFFTPRDRKYPNGARPSRTAASGYWKATGTDKPILAAYSSQCIGVKKALVFYEGRAAKGTKTNWTMHEYRLLENTVKPSKLRGSSMRLDDWVLCRVRFKGNSPARNTRKDQQCFISQPLGFFPEVDQQYSKNLISTFNDCPVLACILGTDDVLPIQTISTVTFQGGNSSNNDISAQKEPDSETLLAAESSTNIAINKFNPLKRKPFDQKVQNFQCCIKSYRKPSNCDGKFEYIAQSSRNITNTENMSFCKQYQAQDNIIFSSIQSNPGINYEELINSFAFTGGNSR